MSTTWMKKLGLGLILMLSVGLACPAGGAAQAEEPYRYFAETGHIVRGQFLEFFDKYGGTRIFGYPLTEPFVENGLTVQYFQNARFEAHPTNPAPYQVQLGLLGVELKYGSASVAPPSSNSRSRHYFPETGHTVSYAFLDFFKVNGGIDVFGYPITEMHYERGRIVQYFQRLKMEWHPEDRVTPVQIGNLGQLYLNAYRDRIPPEALRAVANPTLGNVTPEATPIGGLQVSLSLRYSVLGKDTDQTVSVHVKTEDGQPLPNAQVRVEVTNAAGKVLGSSPVVLTDARGFVKVPLTVTGGQNGERLFVRATVTSGGVQAGAEDVFLLWW